LHKKQIITCEQIRVYVLWWLTVLVTQVCAEIIFVRFFIAVKQWFPTGVSRTPEGPKQDFWGVQNAI